MKNYEISFVSKQPNGLYCRVSNITHCPTHWNMTEEEYIENEVRIATEKERKKAENNIKNKVEDFAEVKKSYRDGFMTKEEFNNFLKDVENIVY